MVQSSQGVQSTKPSQGRSGPSLPHDALSTPELVLQDILPPTATNELHVWDQSISKLYTDDCGWLPIHARSGHEYIMITYHFDSNIILQTTFANRTDKHQIRVYASIMTRLTNCGHVVNVQIIDNEVSIEYKKVIEEDWKVKYQIIPPDVHRRNIAEQAIRTFKAHFLSVLARVNPTFPKFMWDTILIQTELTLNLLRQATLKPSLSAWE